MKEIKMVLCDLDGTLLNSQGKVSEPTIAKIRELRAKGIMFGLATGRDVDVCELLYESWGLDGLVDIMMGINGAHIVDYIKEEERFFNYTPGEEFKKVIDHFQGLPVNYAISHDGMLKVAYEHEFNADFQRIEQTLVRVYDYEKLLDDSHAKIHVIFRPEYLDLVSSRAKQFADEKLKAVCTGSIMWEVFNKDISKANGIRHLAASHDLDVSNILVFGDGDNDFEMIMEAGIGVAMANASQNVLNIADYTTADNDSDGIAAFIEEHF